MKFANSIVKNPKKIKSTAHVRSNKAGRPAGGVHAVCRVIRGNRTTSRPGGVENKLVLTVQIVGFMDKEGRTNNVVSVSEGFFDGANVHYNVRNGNDELSVVVFRPGQEVKVAYSTKSSTEAAMLPPPKGTFVLLQLSVTRAIYRSESSKTFTDDDGNEVTVEHSVGDPVLDRDGEQIYDWASEIAPDILTTPPSMVDALGQFRTSFESNPIELRHDVMWWPTWGNNKPRVRPHVLNLPSDAWTSIKTSDAGTIERVAWFANFTMENSLLKGSYKNKDTGKEFDLPMLSANFVVAFVERDLATGDVAKKLGIFATSSFCDYPFYVASSLWERIAPAIMQAYVGMITIQYPNGKNSPTASMAEEDYEGWEAPVPPALADNELANAPGPWRPHGFNSNVILTPDIAATVIAAGVPMTHTMYTEFCDLLEHVNEPREYPAPYDDRHVVRWVNQLPLEDRELSSKKYKFVAFFPDDARPASEDEMRALLEARGDRIDDVVFAAVLKSHLPAKGAKEGNKRAEPEEAGSSEETKGRKKRK